MDIVQPPTSDYVPASVLVAPGDIIIRGAAIPTRLAIGTTRQILKVNAVATALEYTNLQALFSKASVDKTDANQVIGAGVNAKITFNTVNFDTDAIFNNVNDRFIPIVPGYYKFYGCVYVATPAALANIRLSMAINGFSVNNFEYRQEVATASSYSIEISCLVYCNGIGDYIELFVNNGFAVNLSIVAAAGYTTMNIVGPF